MPCLEKGGLPCRIDTRYPPPSYLLKEKVTRYASYLNMKKMNMRLGVFAPRTADKTPTRAASLAGWLRAFLV